MEVQTLSHQFRLSPPTTENIFSAVRRGNINYVRQVMLNGFDIKLTCNNRYNTRTILHEAVCRKQIGMVKMLVREFNVEDINRDASGKTALMYACMKGFFYIVRLLTKPENIEITDFNNMTPLLESYATHNFGIAKWLLKKGANHMVCSFTGYTIDRTFVNETLETPIDRLIRQNLERNNFAEQLRRGRELFALITNREQEITNRETRQEQITNRETHQEPERKEKKPRDSIIRAIIKNSIEEEKNCPITMSMLILEDSALTNCYHVFNKHAIEHWLENHTTCPICREECIIWKITSS